MSCVNIPLNVLMFALRDACDSDLRCLHLGRRYSLTTYIVGILQTPLKLSYVCASFCWTQSLPASHFKSANRLRGSLCSSCRSNKAGCNPTCAPWSTHAREAKRYLEELRKEVSTPSERDLHLLEDDLESLKRISIIFRLIPKFQKDRVEVRRAREALRTSKDAAYLQEVRSLADISNFSISDRTRRCLGIPSDLTLVAYATTGPAACHILVNVLSSARLMFVGLF